MTTIMISNNISSLIEHFVDNVDDSSQTAAAAEEEEEEEEEDEEEKEEEEEEGPSFPNWTEEKNTKSQSRGPRIIWAY